MKGSQVSVGMSREEWWRLGYRSRPYLANASDDDVAKRFRDVMNNFTRINEKGQISCIPSGREGEYWMELLIHLLEEYNSRGGIPTDVLPRDSLPRISYPNPPKGFAVLQSREVRADGSCLFKLGKRHHMAAMYAAGQIRIAPASFYSDPSLNHAIRDDELSISAVLPMEEVTITAIDKTTGEPKALELLADVDAMFEVATDYYVYCTCHRYDYQMLDDFEADSVVVIRRPEQFVERLERAAAVQLPGWSMLSRPVMYLDPYNVRREDMVAFTAKHFRFAYQSEYRFIWLPLAPVTELQPVFVDLGPLCDIAEYYVLE